MFRHTEFMAGGFWWLLVALVLGVALGWLIWGRAAATGPAAEMPDDLRPALDCCTAKGREQAQRIAQLEADLARCKAALDQAHAPTKAESQPAAVKPQPLAAPRNGAADDLKLIKGIGPKLEILCHKLGFFHFDQIAAWTTKEIAWVDENLEGFKGRVTRDDWVQQAKALAQSASSATPGETA